LRVAGTAQYDEPEYTREILQDIIIRPAVLMYAGVFAVWIFAMIRVQRSRPPGDTIRGLAMCLMTGSIAGNMWCAPARPLPPPGMHCPAVSVLRRAPFTAASPFLLSSRGCSL
jgi:hypothetical protein